MNADASVGLTGAQTGNTGVYTPTDDPLVQHDGNRAWVVANEGVGTVMQTGSFNQFLGFGVDGRDFAEIGFWGEAVSYNRFNDLGALELLGGWWGGERRCNTS